MKPLITTIIPTYRRPQMLKRAIKSVLNQTYTNFQVCVYDNASNDDTKIAVAELAKIDPRVKYYCHKENIGPRANFNYGLKEVNTPFFSMLSDDDVLLPTFYETALEGFNEHRDAVFSSGMSIVTNEHEVLDVFPRNKSGGYHNTPESILEMLRGNVGVWTSVLFRKEVIETEGLLDLEVGGPADADWFYRVAAHNPWVVSKNPSALFVIHSASYNHTTSDYRFVWPGWLKMVKKISEDEKIPLETRLQVEQILMQQLKQWLYELGTRAVLEDDFNSAYASAELLRKELDDRRRAAFLRYRAKIRQHREAEYAYALLRSAAKQIRRINKHSRKKKELTKRYGTFLRYIDKVS